MRALFILFLFAAALVMAGADQPTSPGYQTANQTLNAAMNYVAAVNSSGYLIFYPHLDQAYADLASAQKILNTSPSGSVVFANRATQEASAEYDRMNSYRTEALLIMLALTIASLVFLAMLTIPVKGRRRRSDKASKISH